MPDTTQFIPDTVTLALVQMSCVEQQQSNVEKAIAQIAAAAAQGAQGWRHQLAGGHIQPEADQLARGADIGSHRDDDKAAHV